MSGRNDTPYASAPTDGHERVTPRRGVTWRAVAAAGVVLAVVSIVAASVLLSGEPPAAPGDASPATVPPASTRPVPEDAFLLMSRSALMELPTSGEAWDRIAASAEAKWPKVRLDDRDSDALPHALAAALVFARTGDERMRARVVDALKAIEGEDVDDLLAVVRQLGGWVIAADLVGYRDRSFAAWLRDIRRREIGNHPRWKTVFDTAGSTANNYGTFSLASLIAIDRFLDDGPGLDRDWEIFAGYGIPFGWPFQKTEDWDQGYSCTATDPAHPERLPIAIDPPGCQLLGVEVDGMPVEDAAREGDPPRPHEGYVNEAMQGYAMQALLLDGAGYDAWSVNDEQVRRVAEFQVRAGIWNAHPTGYPVAWIVNDAYGLQLPAEPETAGGRMIAWTDWLFPR